MEAMTHQHWWLWRSLYESAAMFWEVLWALVLGFAVSAALQVFVSKERMTQALGRAGLREVALATAFGAASSSCSYAAVAAARTAFKKGAALVPTLAFMFASTNLVFELGFVLWLLMGWHFVLAELVGAFVLIGVMWLIVSLTLPKGLEDEARAYEEGEVQAAAMTTAAMITAAMITLGTGPGAANSEPSRTPSRWTGA